MKNMTRKRSINKAFRLLYIDFFFKHAIKECIINNNLFDRPPKIESKSKHNPDNGKLDHRIKDILEIKPGTSSQPLATI